MGKEIDTSWDFKNQNTKEFTHCFHTYPAMMIPQVARRIINEYGKKTKLLFDPYCGTGTSLVEANLNNIDSIGIDINPLACLVAKAKTTPISLQTLNLYLKDYNTFIFHVKHNMIDEISIVLPTFKNIDFWFEKSIQANLAQIKQYIDRIEEENIRNFFLVAFSETIRDCSWTKNSEFKLVRMNKEQIMKFKVDVFNTMDSKLFRNKKGMMQYLSDKSNGSYTRIYTLNTVKEIPNNIIEDHSADLVITSPPYGDSRTTVAYGQFSRLSNQWMGYENANQLDNEMMGGKRNNVEINSCSIHLKNTIRHIKEIDTERSKDVISFFYDYKKSVDNVSKKIKKGGYACYVIGNRTVKGIQIPTSEITKDFFIENGFMHVKTEIRNIPNKRMPSKNSPSNIKGKKSPTMKNEYIVICKKD
ncbi:MAG: DNA methyltransferase [Ignavibacteria bacterium]|jgi:DNA modification methylase